MRHLLCALLLTGTIACAPPPQPKCVEMPTPAPEAAHEHHAEEAAPKPVADAAKANPKGTEFTIAAATADADVHPQVLHEDDDVKIAVLTIKVGAKMSEHAAPVPVTVQTISGTGSMTVSGQPFQLEASKVVHLDAHAPHALEASGSEPLVVLVHYLKGGKETGGDHHHGH